MAQPADPSPQPRLPLRSVAPPPGRPAEPVATAAAVGEICVEVAVSLPVDGPFTYKVPARM